MKKNYVICPHCGKFGVRKHGSYETYPKPRFSCSKCKKTFNFGVSGFSDEIKTPVFLQITIDWYKDEISKLEIKLKKQEEQIKKTKDEIEFMENYISLIKSKQEKPEKINTNLLN